MLWGLSDPKIGDSARVSGRLDMSGGKSPRHAQNPLLGKWRKTISTAHHALSLSITSTPDTVMSNL